MVENQGIEDIIIIIIITDMITVIKDHIIEGMIIMIIEVMDVLMETRITTEMAEETIDLFDVI